MKNKHILQFKFYNKIFYVRKVDEIGDKQAYVTLTEQPKLIGNSCIFNDVHSAQVFLTDLTTRLTNYSKEYHRQWNRKPGKLLSKQMNIANYIIVPMVDQELLSYKKSSKTNLMKWIKDNPNAVHCNMCGYNSLTKKMFEVGNYRICSICLEKLGMEATSDIKEVEKSMPEYRNYYAKQVFSDEL